MELHKVKGTFSLSWDWEFKSLRKWESAPPFILGWSGEWRHGLCLAGWIPKEGDRTRLIDSPRLRESLLMMTTGAVKFERWRVKRYSQTKVHKWKATVKWGHKSEKLLFDGGTSKWKASLWWGYIKVKSYCLIGHYSLKSCCQTRSWANETPLFEMGAQKWKTPLV